MMNAKCKRARLETTFTFSIHHRSGDPVYIYYFFDKIIDQPVM